MKYPWQLYALILLICIVILSNTLGSDPMSHTINDKAQVNQQALLNYSESRTTHLRVNPTKNHIYENLALPFLDLNLTPISFISKLALNLREVFGNQKPGTETPTTNLVGLSNGSYNEAAELEQSSDNNPSDKVTQTYINEIIIGINSSRFTCPTNLPYAISYTLQNENSDKNATVMTQGYTNGCSKGAGGQAFSDLLYGMNQQPNDNYGKASELTAFIPKNIPEGCTNGPWSNQSITINFEADTEITPQIRKVDGQSAIVGFEEVTMNRINCTNVCKNLIAAYCEADQSKGYCGEVVVSAYKIKSVYLARNISENFCSCSIAAPDWDASWAFTNAVDIESAVTHNNILTSVTCSNIGSE